MKQNRNYELSLFDEVYDLLFQRLQEVFQDYKNKIIKEKEVELIYKAKNGEIIRQRVALAKQTAIWWKKKPTVAEFFSFPNPGINFFSYARPTDYQSI